MLTDEELETRCNAVVRTIEALCVALAEGRLRLQEFMREVLEVESEQVSKAGLILVASNSEDDWIHFAVRAKRSADIRAAFEFNPETAQFRGEFDALGGVLQKTA